MVKVIGLMSGTSADGVDAALVEFTEERPGELCFNPIAYSVQPLSSGLRNEVLKACRSESNTAEICRLNTRLGEVFAAAVNTLLEQHGINPSEVDLIASHGQTVWHEPSSLATLQLAEPAVIANLTGISVAANFRTGDVAAGGQGAPLAPYFDWLFFRDSSKGRALLNIGGIGNVTFIPAGAAADEVRAFDTGPGNVLLDMAASHYSEGKLTYDIGGQMAAAGQVNRVWLENLLSDPYYAIQPPKSTGRELYSAAYFETLRKEAVARGLLPADVMATLTALTAESIIRAIRDFGPVCGIQELVVSGGGGNNPCLMQMLTDGFGDKVSVRLFEDFGFDGKLKEAVFFALLGYELLRGRPGNLPSCTGASGPVVLGQLTPGRNFARLAAFMAANLPAQPLEKLVLNRPEVLK